MKSASKLWADSALQPNWERLGAPPEAPSWERAAPWKDAQPQLGLHKNIEIYTSGLRWLPCKCSSYHATKPWKLKFLPFKTESQRKTTSHLQTTGQHLCFQQQVQPEDSLTTPEQLLGTTEKALCIKLISWGRRTWQLVAGASGL